jgi:ankyrin repeat protein
MDVSRRASELGSALCKASFDNKIVDICRLVSQGADLNYVHRCMHEGKEISITPLSTAAVCGHADAVRVLMSRAAEVNKQEPCDRQTALHVAAQECHVPVMELLMSKGGQVLM